jgi:hypothetical protein
MEKKWDTVIPADLKRLFVSGSFMSRWSKRFINWVFRKTQQGDIGKIEMLVVAWHQNLQFWSLWKLQLLSASKFILYTITKSECIKSVFWNSLCLSHLQGHLVIFWSFLTLSGAVCSLWCTYSLSESDITFNFISPDILLSFMAPCLLHTLWWTW